MKGGSLFFIGLLSAILTIISLNFAFGSRWNNYNYYHRNYHSCFNGYDKQHHDSQNQSKADSSNSNY